MFLVVRRVFSSTYFLLFMTTLHTTSYNTLLRLQQFELEKKLLEKFFFAKNRRWIRKQQRALVSTQKQKGKK